jgi:hypothetical protein
VGAVTLCEQRRGGVQMLVGKRLNLKSLHRARTIPLLYAKDLDGR